MTSNQHLFASLSRTQGGEVTFGDDGLGKIVSIDNISRLSSSILKNILLVDGLETNLISVSQLCDKDLDVTFKRSKCSIVNNVGVLVFETSRERNVYTIDINDLSNQSVECLK